MSPLAQQLLEIIKSKGGSVWEDDAITLLFPKPFPFASDLTREQRIEYWQWDVCTHGGDYNRWIDP